MTDDGFLAGNIGMTDAFSSAGKRDVGVPCGPGGPPHPRYRMNRLSYYDNPTHGKLSA